MDLLEQRPDSPEWRADALARSGHSRLTDDGPLPACYPDNLPETSDPCGEICRALLGDFAPALLLLDAASRRRVQALVAFARALDDCAREQGTEGQRLAALNRWEFALDAALDGASAEHPAFAAMARADALLPWPRTALAALFASARKRAIRTAPDQRSADESVAALGEALLGQPPSARLLALAAAILNSPRPQPEGETTRDAIRPEAGGGGSLPEGAIHDAPLTWRAALRYSALAAQAHIASAQRSGRARSLRAGTRLVLLARARWGALPS